MSRYIVRECERLEGKIRAQGAKNSVLALLSATLMTGDEMILHNCPVISDVDSALEILEQFGCRVKREEHTVLVDSAGLFTHVIPERLMRKMLSSVIFLGALLSRTGKATISCPGGCELGPRPIDLHLSALECLSVEFQEDGGEIHATAIALEGTDIHLSFPSVGATENSILASCTARGVTHIFNAARESEIVDLQNLLNAMGANIWCEGRVAIVEGVKRLHGANVVATDLRGGAGLVMAGLSAKGMTQIEQAELIERGYENMPLVLQSLGADVRKEE